MPFTPNVVDDFNRADGGLGANWLSTGIFTGSANWSITSNVANGLDGTATALWSALLGADQKVHARVMLTPDIRLYWRVTNDGSSSATGYCIYRNGSELYVFRNDTGGAGALTQLGATISQSFTAGDSIGVIHVDDEIQVWFKAGAGSWTQIATRNDSTYDSAGRVGMYGASQIDDFGAETIIAEVPAGAALHRSRSMPLFDDEQVARFEFFPAITPPTVVDSFPPLVHAGD